MIRALTRSFAPALLTAFTLQLVLGCAKSDKPSPTESGTPSANAKSSASAAIPTLPQPSAASPPEPPPAPSGPLNVILLTVDSLRAEMPWTGYSRPIAPYLTKLAEQGAVYTNAYSISSYTAKSVATMLSGRYPSTLYRDGLFFAKYPSSNLFIPELFAERGIRSMAWHAHLYFGRGKGLEQGFDEWRLVPGITFDPETDKHVTSDKMTALGMELLGDAKNTGKQFFAWAHYMDPHDQYQQHKESPEFGRKARDRYDSEVWYTDLWLGKLLDWAKTQPWWSRTVVIVSADHGETFGEHDMYKHAFEVWEVLTRVPLLVVGPGISPRRIDERRSHIDLAPTILELMGVPIPSEFQGRSLVAELRGGPAESREPIVVELAEDSHNPKRRGLILGDYKIIDFGRGKFQLYNLKKDPGELQDLASTEKDELKRMQALLEEKYSKLPTVEPYGGNKLRDGGTARGPVGPKK